VTLGLLGTVIGFAMALSGVDSASLASAAGVQKVAGQLMAGMRTAINTTIVGAVLGLWLDVNRRMIRTATVSLAEDARARVGSLRETPLAFRPSLEGRVES
jgi:hypothetical protein